MHFATSLYSVPKPSLHLYPFTLAITVYPYTDLSNRTEGTSLLFGPLNTTHSLNFSSLEDDIVEVPETLTILLSSGDARVIVVAPESSVVFMDNDGKL